MSQRPSRLERAADASANLIMIGTFVGIALFVLAFCALGIWAATIIW